MINIVLWITASIMPVFFSVWMPISALSKFCVVAGVVMWALMAALMQMLNDLQDSTDSKESIVDGGRIISSVFFLSYALWPVLYHFHVLSEPLFRGIAFVHAIIWAVIGISCLVEDWKEIKKK